ncbi:YHYH domain-containing protein [Robertmurraya massiliosenegalensis]|uniref:YHYH domain-containing protein n=1 Tax=Robertmurraya TaxID=2837507 RepID=UPI0039A56375
MVHRKIATLIFVLLLFFPLVTLAHPGGTDSSGGHTCRTNCEKWGLEYGEYHYHNSHPSVDYYSDGYNQGYDYAYSYTSVCEEDYEWWWEGPQEFGNGYEAGIEDGHFEGLQVCFEDSYQFGYDAGFEDSQNEYEYNEEPYLTVDEPSYGEGYADGYADSESEKPDEYETVSSEDVALGVEASAFEKYLSSQKSDEYMYEEGYEDGYEIAVKGYLYDDYIARHTDAERKPYQEGYYEGWVAGGGGSWEQNIWFWSLKNPTAKIVIPIIAIVLLGVVLLFIHKKNKRHKKAKTEDKELTLMQEMKPVLIILVISILLIYGITKIFWNEKDTEPVTTVEDSNPYNY